MPYTLFKFIHVGSMFLATALAIGPAALLYLVARSGTPRPSAGRGHPRLIFRAGVAFYGLGLLFGFVTAVNGYRDPWLIAPTSWLSC